MYILAFDTTSKYDSCSIVDLKGSILSNISMISIKQSESIIDLIDFAIKSAGISKKDISKIVTCSGPGSYVGTRIGLSTLVGLSKSLKIEALCLNIFDILSYDNIYIPFMEKRGKYYLYSKEISEVSKEYILGSEDIFITEKTSSLKGDNIRYIDDSLTRSVKMAKIVVDDSEKVSKNIEAIYL